MCAEKKKEFEIEIETDAMLRAYGLNEIILTFTSVRANTT